jgi:hypothetical protein
MAVGRLPETGPDLCSQPAMTRLENLPGPVALKRMMAAMVELFRDSFDALPQRIALDIDDTEDRTYGGQQLSLFNAHHDSRCFMPIHIYEAISANPVAVFPRSGKTPDGTEVCLVLRHVVRAIRARWPRVDILIGGDSHYGRPAGMAWCERNRVGYIFGLAGSKVLLRRVTGEAGQVALDRLDAPAGTKVRRYTEFLYAAKIKISLRPALPISTASQPSPPAWPNCRRNRRGGALPQKTVSSTRKPRKMRPRCHLFVHPLRE